MKRSRWIGHAKGLLRIVHQWQASAKQYPNDKHWQANCEANINELKKTAKMYLNWMKNERTI